MVKIILHLVVLCLLLQPFPSVAQLNTSAVLLKEEKSKFLLGLKSSRLDPNITSRLTRFGESEVDSIQQFLIAVNTLSDAEKEKALRSLFSFIKGLSENIKQPKPEMYDLPAILESYKTILRSLLYQKPLRHELIQIGPWSSQLLAAAFRQYSEYDLLNDVTAYKNMVASPEYIFQFLENKPGFRFADSLLVKAAANDPLKMG